MIIDDNEFNTIKQGPLERPPVDVVVIDSKQVFEEQVEFKVSSNIILSKYNIKFENSNGKCQFKGRNKTTASIIYSADGKPIFNINESQDGDFNNNICLGNNYDSQKVIGHVSIPPESLNYIKYMINVTNLKTEQDESLAILYDKYSNGCYILYVDDIERYSLVCRIIKCVNSSTEKRPKFIKKVKSVINEKGSKLVKNVKNVLSEKSPKIVKNAMNRKSYRIEIAPGVDAVLMMGLATFYLNQNDYVNKRESVNVETTQRHISFSSNADINRLERVKSLQEKNNLVDFDEYKLYYSYLKYIENGNENDGSSSNNANRNRSAPAKPKHISVDLNERNLQCLYLRYIEKNHE